MDVRNELDGDAVLALLVSVEPVLGVDVLKDFGEDVVMEVVLISELIKEAIEVETLGDESEVTELEAIAELESWDAAEYPKTKNCDSVTPIGMFDPQQLNSSNPQVRLSSPVPQVGPIHVAVDIQKVTLGLMQAFDNTLSWVIERSLQPD